MSTIAIANQTGKSSWSWANKHGRVPFLRVTRRERLMIMRGSRVHWILMGVGGAGVMGGGRHRLEGKPRFYPFLDKIQGGYIKVFIFKFPDMNSFLHQHLA